MAIRENATVNVIGGLYKGNTGKVIRIYGNVGIALVQLENGDLGKVYLSEMVEIRPQETEPKPEIPEGAKKISRAAFLDALRVVTDPATIFSDAVNPVDFLHATIEGMASITLGHKLAEVLFKDTDVAVVTEDDFVRALWKICDPASVVERSLEASAFDGLLISVSSVIRLRELVPILFGGENG